jgi:glycosyltransferase involved in cell wall biosynthesis
MAAWTEHCDFIAAISKSTRQDLIRLAPAHKHKVHTVSLAASPSSSQLGKSDQSRTGSSTRSFLYPAGLNETKGHVTLFEAICALSRQKLPFHLVLTGGGTERFLQDECLPSPNLEGARLLVNGDQQLREKHLRVRGKVSRKELDELYLSSDCVVLPSHFEGFGIPLTEALTCGKRVICSDIPPFREQVERYGAEDWVSFFPVGDSKRLEKLMAAEIQTLATPSNGEALRDRMLAWSWDDVATQLLSLFGDSSAACNS